MATSGLTTLKPDISNGWEATAEAGDHTTGLHGHRWEEGKEYLVHAGRISKCWLYSTRTTESPPRYQIQIRHTQDQITANIWVWTPFIHPSLPGCPVGHTWYHKFMDSKDRCERRCHCTSASAIAVKWRIRVFLRARFLHAMWSLVTLELDIALAASDFDTACWEVVERLTLASILPKKFASLLVSGNSYPLLLGGVW